MVGNDEFKNTSMESVGHVVYKHFGFSVIGSLHERLSLPNQDAFCHHLYQWGELIAVSDGLGSHATSEIGSKAACDAAHRLLMYWHKHPKLLVKERLAIFHKFWLDQLAGQDLSKCGCTILMVLRLGNTVFWAQLGDGLSVLYRNSKDHPECLTENSNELFSNQTYALSANFCMSQWQSDIFKAQECKALFLCTDGIADDVKQGQQTAFFKQLFIQYQYLSTQQIIDDIQHWLKHWPVPGHSDDKTLVAMIVEEVL